jgi:hypothetical protein
MHNGEQSVLVITHTNNPRHPPRGYTVIRIRNLLSVRLRTMAAPDADLLNRPDSFWHPEHPRQSIVEPQHISDFMVLVPTCTYICTLNLEILR